MILAIIFLITDLFMVGIAYAVYGRTAVEGYSDGMVLGVHIRREKQEDPVLVEFMKNYKKRCTEGLFGTWYIRSCYLWIVFLVYINIYVCVVCMVSVLYCGRSRCHVQESQETL